MENNYKVHEETRHGYKIEIHTDINPFFDPVDNEQNDTTFLVFYHDQFDVRKDDMITKNELIDYFLHGAEITPAEYYFIFPLSALIHSGVHLYMGRNDHPADAGGWDSSFAGAVLIHKSVCAGRREHAQGFAESYIDWWNDYLSGNVYMFRIYTPAGELIDTMSGFFGDYNDEGGALSEARRTVDHITNEGRTDHQGQYLIKY